jgi:glycosyltransferase involved in cell wall biosynthesis
MESIWRAVSTSPIPYSQSACNGYMRSMDIRKVTVCMAVYNGEKYICEQLKSILSQLKDSDELIVVDDCSQDSSLEIIRSFNDERIIILRNSLNGGVVKAFEMALKKSSGDFIFFADQDDIWLPGKVEECIEYLHKTRRLAIVTDARVIDESRNVLHDSYFQLRHSGSGFFKNFYKTTYVGCCMAVDASVKQYVLPFPSDIPMHDQWIGLVCEVLGGVSFLPKVLIEYRRHSNNQTKIDGSLNWLLIFKKRAILVKLCLTRLLFIYWTVHFSSNTGKIKNSLN